MNRDTINRVIQSVRLEVPPKAPRTPRTSKSEWERRATAAARNITALRLAIYRREALIGDLEDLLGQERTLACAERLEKELTRQARDQHMLKLAGLAHHEADARAAVYLAKHRNGKGR